ncbi:hypothetical protein BS636_00005 [Acinetobacter sp. LoGeW2-3]|uniref:glutamine amidotransferase-related protein n=1 Tax=Acinetobacter sp. LoGeW2-3 TaxID=1808001 RepID=UPI000C05A285|nr:hypothetical protein BS636_00005 [Acinetobacter sp. LoGeW2-3]
MTPLLITVQYFGELNQEVKVVRNDAVTLEDIERWQPKYLVIGPGPCSPSEAGISIPAIQHFSGKIPLLGVCLGHQSIGQAFGGDIVRAKRVMHGRLSDMYHSDKGIFSNLLKECRIYLLFYRKTNHAFWNVLEKLNCLR